MTPAEPTVPALLASDRSSADGAALSGSGAIPRPGGGRNGSRDFHGERRRNETHASTTDPAARLFRKGPGKVRVWMTSFAPAFSLAEIRVQQGEAVRRKAGKAGGK